jgi:hypothetical protein
VAINLLRDAGTPLNYQRFTSAGGRMASARVRRPAVVLVKPLPPCCFPCLADIFAAIQRHVREAADILVVVPGGFKIEQGIFRSCSRGADEPPPGPTVTRRLPLSSWCSWLWTLTTSGLCPRCCAMPPRRAGRVHSLPAVQV